MHVREIEIDKAKDIIESVRKNTHNKLNFEGLFDLLETHNVRIRFVEFKVNAVGIATFDCIYVNLNFLHRIDIIYYTILHEMGHYLRINRFGFEYYVEHFLNNTIEDFFKYVINEEIIADRYAGFVGHYLNKDNTCFRNYSQGLEDVNKQEEYKELIEDLFDSIPKDYDEYVKFVHENIVYVK